MTIDEEPGVKEMFTDPKCRWSQEETRWWIWDGDAASVHLFNKQSKCAYVKEYNLASHYEANCGNIYACYAHEN